MWSSTQTPLKLQSSQEPSDGDVVELKRRVVAGAVVLCCAPSIDKFRSAPITVVVDVVEGSVLVREELRTQREHAVNRVRVENMAVACCSSRHLRSTKAS